MFRYAKNLRLASLRLSLALSGSLWLSVTPTLALTFSLWPPSSIQSLPYYEVIIVGIIQNPVVVCIVLYPLFSIHLLASPAKTS